METFGALFKDFGYPALVSGILLYILTVNLEKMKVAIQEQTKTLIVLNQNTLELRTEVKELHTCIEELLRDRERRRAS